MERRFIRIEVDAQVADDGEPSPDPETTLNRLLAEGWRVETLATGSTVELPAWKDDAYKDRWRDAQGRIYRNWILAVLVRDA